jgi:hypothetical protein
MNSFFQMTMAISRSLRPFHILGEAVYATPKKKKEGAPSQSHSEQTGKPQVDVRALLFSYCSN